MRAALLATTILGVMTPSAGFAQATTAPQATKAAPSEAAASADSTATPPAGTAQNGLGDIIVTAQRRAENAQRAAVAISAVQGADLVRAGVTQVDRLSEQVPALTILPTTTGNAVFIRGVGNFTLTPNSDPATAFNYDGVYVGRPTGTAGVFYDLERVEVLKGPQGTLYGRNATAGAINIIPVQPKPGELGAYGSVSYGNYNAVIAEGAANLPLGPDGALRISGMESRHDAYLRDGTSTEQIAGVRVQLKARLTPQLTVRVASDYSHVGGTGNTVSYLGAYAYNAAAGRYVFRPSGLPIDEGLLTARAAAFRTTLPSGPAARPFDPVAPLPFQRNDLFGANAQIDWTTGIGTFTIVPGWRYGKLDYLATFGAYYREREKDNQYNLEARLTGRPIGPLDYTLGVFFYHEAIDLRTAVSLSAAANFLTQSYRTNSFAPFGRLTLHVDDRLRLVGGLRYTNDRKSFTGTTVGNTIICAARVAGVPSCPTVPLFPVVEDPAQLPFRIPAASGGTLPILVNGMPTGAIVARADRLDNSRLKNTRFTYRAAVEFDAAARSLLYASVETGHRSGGFAPATGFETYEPEYITAYTLGSKNRFFDNRVQLNVEAFW